MARRSQLGDRLPADIKHEIAAVAGGQLELRCALGDKTVTGADDAA